MKPATISQIKKDLKALPQNQLINLCLRVAKHKTENKELLSYLLYDADNEEQYIENIKSVIDEQFLDINITGYYYIKKSIRKILRNIKKHIRYSKRKDTEATLLLYFCNKLKNLRPSYKKNTVLVNMYNRQLELAKNAISKLHEDLQFDFKQELENLTD